MSRTDPDPREAKLPMWAQNMIARLRTDAQIARTELADHKASLVPTNRWHGNYTNPIYLPDNGTSRVVHFNTHGTEDVDPHFMLHDIQVRHGDANEHRQNWVYVSAGDTLLIEPASANAAWMRTRR